VITDKQKTMDARIRGASGIVLLGVLVEAVTLVWAGPVSFLVFMLLGCALVVLGIVYYLISLVTV
jgi:hypothetical protein